MIGHAMLAAPGQQVILDAPPAQVVEHLVGADLGPVWQTRPAPACWRGRSCSRPSGGSGPCVAASERRPRFLEWHAATPMQQVQVEPSVPSRFRLASHATMVPRRVACCGSTLLTRKTSSRRPLIAAPTSSSDAPPAYISAVSISSGPARGQDAKPRSRRPGGADPRPCARCPVPARASLRPMED